MLLPLVTLIGAVCFRRLGAWGTPQALAVKGRVLCGAQPLHNISVRLVDLDLESFPEVMGEMITEDDGVFTLSGTESEFMTINPALQFRHFCGTRLYPYCSENMLNKSFVEFNQTVPTMLHELGDIELLHRKHECGWW